MVPVIVEGDLLEQSTEAIVNAWNRNIIPWWLLVPHGVSGAIRRRAGLKPFWELGWKGPLPLGHAVATSAGRLPYRAIIHVAGINMGWVATRESIQQSAVHAVELAASMGLALLAMPIIGGGVGGFTPQQAEDLILQALAPLDLPVQVTLVRYRRP